MPGVAIDTRDEVLNPTGGGDALDVVARGLVNDLHQPKPAVFWSDLLGSAAIGWAAFVLAVVSVPFSTVMFVSAVVSGLALYRGLCFTHEITHLKRSAVPGFETAWNVLFGVPLLLPSFTYVGVHQSHHSLSTYGTDGDPEYLPFASSRKLIALFTVQSSFLTPLVLPIRFLVIGPVGLVWPRLHRWLETYASSFAMNPEYRRAVTPAVVGKMRRWEAAIMVAWAIPLAMMIAGVLPWRTLPVWFGVIAFISLLNTLRVLGAHEYETDGTPRNRHEQLGDSIDTPGGFWTELWAPVGLRYHALHHYFPGIPYHNLGVAYGRLVSTLPQNSTFRDSTSPSLPRSLKTLHDAAKRGRPSVS